MKTLLLATRNPGKVKEIQAILSGVPLTITSLLDQPGLPEVVEDGATLEENARKKAREIFEATGLPTLSDDTGLEVYHLGMKPGVISARYAGEHATYEMNYRKLLHEMAGVPAGQRGARFRCVAYYIDKEIEERKDGTCEGTITDSPRGKGGFGYDPVFLPEGYMETFAELSESVKNQISHRAKAFLQMKNILLTRFA
ncbi:MAG TPA: RdgB/HAM1 family non-canonical purine NTP pyrophosphatase [Bacteroidota bacterium]|nr:RdgB/HAM1 family non-canonical purine NTP pyrophosphatase [Bacteroidota bacterium]